MRVTSTTAAAEGLVLVGDSVNGEATIGARVNLVQMPPPHIDEHFGDEPPEEQKRFATDMVAALLEAPKAAGRVLSWDPATSTLVVSGVSADQAPVGTLALG